MVYNCSKKVDNSPLVRILFFVKSFNVTMLKVVTIWQKVFTARDADLIYNGDRHEN